MHTVPYRSQSHAHLRGTAGIHASVLALLLAVPLTAQTSVRGWNKVWFDTEVHALRPKSISAWGDVTLVLRADGCLFAQGWNNYGQCAVPDLPFQVSYVEASAGGMCVARRSDGVIVQWGNGAPPQLPPTLAPGTAWTQLAAGAAHSLVLRSDGAVLAWGNNQSGQCNVPVLAPGLTYRRVASGSAHSIGLVSDGTIRVWGNNNYGQLVVPAFPTGVAVTRIAGGNANHSLVLLSNGSVIAWGDNAYGQCNVPLPPPGVVYTDIRGGTFHSLAMRSDGVIVGWGYNAFGQCDPQTLRQSNVCSVSRP